MTKTNNLEKVSGTLATKAALLIGTFGLLASLNGVMAQCPVPTITPSGSVDLCTGGSVTLTASAGSAYNWSNGATSQSIVVSTAGSYVVTVDDGAGCIEASLPTPVSKNTQTPGAVNTLNGVTKACPGESIANTINPAHRAVTYTWTLSAGATIAGQSVYTTSSTAVTIDYSAGFVASGNVTIYATNGCGNGLTLSRTLTRNNPLTPVSISGSAATCENTTYTFSTPVVSNITNYQWTGPVGSVITNQGSDQVDITFPAGYVVGTVQVVNQNSCGSSTPKGLTTRSVLSKPDDISGPVSGLCGSTQTFTIPAKPGATSYTWTAPAGCTITSGQGTTSVDIFFDANLDNGYVRVVANNSCGSSGETKMRVDGEVTISQNPVDAEICDGTGTTFTVVSPGLGISYQWRKNGVPLTDNATYSGTSTATLTVSGAVVADAGAYDCIVSNNCSTPLTSSAAALLVKTIPTVPGLIAGIDVACPGYVAQSFTIAPVAGADSYVWTGYNGASISGGQGTANAMIDFGASSNSGYNIDVRASNACGVSDSSKKWIRRTISVPTFSIAPASACAGSAGVSFEVNTVVGANSYTWIAPAGASVASGQGTKSATIDFSGSFTNGDVCVYATNLCGSTEPRCKKVISIPASPGSIGGPGYNVCNSTQTYYTNLVAGATLYTWSVPAGASINSCQGTNSISVTFDPSYISGSIGVIAKNNCGDSPMTSRLVQAFLNKPAAIFGSPTTCANSHGNVYSIDPMPGAISYQWVVPSGAVITSGATTNSIEVDFGSIDGIISARGINACGPGFSGNFRVTFNCRTQGSSSVKAELYPNPAKDRVIISHDSNVSGKATIEVRDLTGRTMISKDVMIDQESGRSEIDITELSSGIYLVEITSAQGKSVNRFVKK
ncbi:MAG: T9SS type A sorting domain-containing protein [Bacteroidetes bacterium]|nr:T9SS type A sorting domain-containing protein [Bacteroidota bacterium]